MPDTARVRSTKAVIARIRNLITYGGIVHYGDTCDCCGEELHGVVHIKPLFGKCVPFSYDAFKLFEEKKDVK